MFLYEARFREFRLISALSIVFVEWGLEGLSRSYPAHLFAPKQLDSP